MHTPDPSMNPGDEAPAGSPGSGTGQAVCARCAGRGRLAGDVRCPDCGGTGKVIEGIGGG